MFSDHDNPSTAAAAAPAQDSEQRSPQDSDSTKLTPAATETRSQCKRRDARGYSRSRGAG